eukprot:gene14423-5557_t
MVVKPGAGMVVPAAAREQLEQDLGVDTEAVMTGLLPHVRYAARPAVSQYFVGAVGLGASGDLILGVNLEFGGLHIGSSVHAEQFMLVNAFNRGEAAIEAIAVTAAPCGHCRQFLQELPGAADVQFLMAAPSESEPTSHDDPGVAIPTKASLGKLLPSPFGPADLGVTSFVLPASAATLGSVGKVERSVLGGGEGTSTVEYGGREQLQPAAEQAAAGSYAPYSGSAAGVALLFPDGVVFGGAYLESAAFNPSMPPMQAALIAALAEGRDPADIQQACLVQNQRPSNDPNAAGFCVAQTSQQLLASAAPAAAPLHVVSLP